MKFLKTTTIRKAPPLVLAGVLAGLLAPLAHAQTQVTNAAQGDVIIAFRNTADSATGSYLVNAGPVSQFLSATPGSPVPLALVGALGGDLDAYDTFIEDEQVPWHTRIQVVWSAFSRNSLDNEVVYVTRARTSPAQQSNPWGPRNGYQHGVAFSEISSLIGQGFNVLTSTLGVPDSANNPRGGFQTTPFTGSTSYLGQVATPGQQDFRTWSNVEQHFGAGSANALLDFYVHRKGPSIAANGTVDYLGYFSIDAAGVVSFTRAGADPGDIDTDGDGFTDAEEELAGTDPNDPSDFFLLPPPVRTSEGETHIQLDTVADRRYVVEYSENLQTWTEVHVHLSGSGADPLDFLDDHPERSGKPAGFYRVIVGLP